jgi:dienelactone hydrolase
MQTIRSSLPHGLHGEISIGARRGSQVAVLAAVLVSCMLPAFGAAPAGRSAKPSGPSNRPPEDPAVIQRNDAYAKQLEAHLLHWLVDEYPVRSASAWQRDYTNPDAFVRSVGPNRERWRQMLNPPALRKTGELQRRLHSPLADIKAEWIILPLGGLTAEGILVFPPQASGASPVPLIVAQHGIGSTPESPFGPPTSAYHGYGRKLLKAGFAVLAPFNLRSVPSRNHIERLTRLAGTTLPGVEFSRLQHLLDEVLVDARVDRERVGMWGVSLGGMATMFFMPLEPRIKAGVVSAWFNHRLTKMAVADPRYSAFIATAEEHAFFNNWLVEFADHDAITLICPRPVMVHHGKKDGIAHWPDLVAEFNVARSHYEKLGMGDRMELDLHEGGHEARVESGIRFLKRWLAQP